MAASYVESILVIVDPGGRVSDVALNPESGEIRASDPGDGEPLASITSPSTYARASAYLRRKHVYGTLPVISVTPAEHARLRTAMRNRSEATFGELFDLADRCTETELRADDATLIDRTFDYVDEHFAEPLRLNDVARALGLSPAYLTDALRRRTGTPLHKWIARRRMEHAMQMLCETAEPVARIARRCGFRDPNYFHRAFVRSNGVAPSKWRTITANRARDSAQSIKHTRDMAFEYATLFTVVKAIGSCDRVVFNTRDSSGVWIRQYEDGMREECGFSDRDASLPMLLRGATLTEYHLTHSYHSYYQRLARQKNIGAFVKVPVMVGGRCAGAVIASYQDPGATSGHVRDAMRIAASAYALSVTAS